MIKNTSKGIVAFVVAGLLTLAPLTATVAFADDATPPTDTSTTASADPTPTDTSSPTPTDTSSAAPVDTSSPAPVDTSSPAPTDTSSPAPTDTNSPAPTDTSSPAPQTFSRFAPLVQAGNPAITNVNLVLNADNSVTITWDNPTDNSFGATATYLYLDSYNDDYSYNTYVQLDGNSYTFQPILSSGTYGYGLYPYNGNIGNYDYTNNYATTTDLTINAVATAPTAPTNLTISGITSNAVTANWDAPTDNGGATIDTYTASIYDESSNLVDQKIVDSTNFSYRFTGLTPISNYTVQVSATNSAGTSDVNSTTTSTIADVPNAPTLYSAYYNGRASATTYNLYVFGASNNDNGSAITNYAATITGEGDGSTHTIDLGATGAGTIEFPFTRGVIYDVTITATNEIGTSDVSDSVNLGAVPDDAPTAPTDFVATQNTHSTDATLTWTAPADNGGTNVNDYYLEVYDNEDNIYYADYVDVADVSTIVSNLPADTDYIAYLYAENTVASSDAAVAEFSITSSVADAPQNVDVEGNGTLNSADITWDAPAFDGGNTISSYLVTINGSDDSVLTPSVDGETNSYTVNDLTPGVNYYVTVQAVNNNGNSVSSSPVVEYDNPAVVPSSTVNVHVTYDGTTAHVTWEAPTYNGGSPITGYTVGIGTGNSGDGVDVSSDTFSYDVTPLTENTTYTFSVYANNAVGSSETSDFVTVTTPPVSTPAAPDQSTFTIGTSNGYTVTVVDGVATVTLPGVAEGTWVFGYAFSTPFALGWTQVNANHQATWNITAANLPNGDHKIVVLDHNGNLIGWAGFTVGTVATAATDSNKLATTGSDPSGLLTFAILFLLAGTAAKVARNKRQFNN